MDQQFILSEMRRAAGQNGERPLGKAKFEQLTGISEAAWRGKYWLYWSEATAAAGVRAGELTKAYDEADLLLRLAQLTRKLGHFPTAAEMRMEKVLDSTFPNHKVFDRFGRKADRVEALRTFVLKTAELADLATLLPTIAATAHLTSPKEGELGDGFVYMVRFGKAYKIGRTFSVPRRHREIAMELPQKPEFVHSIRTDDPEGIEGYWHRRFSAKRTNGEWFLLSGLDVKAFKRRRFM